MSTSYSSAKQKYIGNGVTTEWGFDFPIQKHSELKVYLKRSSLPQVLLEEGVDYSFVTENTIAFPIKTGEAKLQATDVLALQRESVFESEYNFSNQQRLEPEEVMHADDNLERQIQELKRDYESAIKVQPTSNINTDEYFIAVESIYENLDNITTVSGICAEIVNCSDNISDISTVSSDIANVNSVGQSISSVNTVASNVSSVNTVAGVSTDVTTVAGISTDVSTVAVNDTNVTTVATNISDVNTAATNIEAIKNAHNQATNAAQSATNAANSAIDSANSATASAASAQQAAISAAGTHFKLFQHQWFDYELNDMAWLRADTFSWQSGTVYTNAYNHLVDDIDGITPATETVGGQTVTFYRASDGHKIVLADQETTVNNIYTATGVAWYYILDTVNNRFKLPRTKYDFNGLRGNVGDYIPESLPNINISSCGIGESNSMYHRVAGYQTSYVARGDGQSGLITEPLASLTSSTYQDNAPVQQRGTQQYLYFYIGQYTQSAIEQTAGLNAELFNNKIDIDGNNVITAGANKILNTSSYTTNRILEIPQDIKLELNNGTLTLKAGSKVYVPNGFEADGTTPKFDVETIASDLTASVSSFSGFLFYRSDNNGFHFESLQPTSGTTPPSENGTWYDTSANKIKRYEYSSFVYDGVSFPLCKFSSGSIDQVFNGFGYIGSTVFALPSVKVQIPDGRNEDGTYKSILKTVESVLQADTFTNDSKVLLNLVDDVLVIGKCSVNANSDIWFDEKTGYMVRKDGNVTQKRSVIIADILSSTKISSFTPYTVDSVLNSNLSNLSAAGQAKFDAKANIDSSNFTAAGKQNIVGWGMTGYFSKPRVLLTSGVWNYADKNILVTIVCNQDLQGEIYINAQASNAGAAEASCCVTPATGGKSSCQAFIRKGIYYKAVFNNAAWYDELMEG